MEPVAERYLPLTPIQEALLARSPRFREESVQVWQEVWDLREPLSTAAFERAWRRALARHASLRTRFRWDEVRGVLRQEVMRGVLPAFARLDWSGLPPERRELELERFLRRDRRRPLDPAEAPLLRWALVRMARDHHVLVVTVHHAVSDGRSAMLIRSQVFTDYAALLRGEAPASEPAPTLAAYLEWIDGHDPEATRAFWRRCLAGVDGPTPLTVDQPIPARASWFQPHSEQDLLLGERETDRLTALAEAREVTVNTLLQAAWALLLARYSGRTDILFGVVRTPRAAFEGGRSIVGALINTLPLRLRVEPSASLGGWLREIRDLWLEMRRYDHVSASAARSLGGLDPEAPLFHTAVAFEKYRAEERLASLGPEWSGRRFRIVRQPDVPLALYGFLGRRLQLKLIYDARRFAPTVVARIHHHLARLLSAMAGAPADALLGTLEPIGTAERHQVLREWNDTAAPAAVPAGGLPPVHRQVRELAREAPDRIAVVAGAEHLSYGELVRRAGALAARLRALGVGPEKRVAVCLPRSPGLFVAVLGILEAGGAYVPLDPGLPRERLTFMLRDANVPVCLTVAAVAPPLAPGVHELRLEQPAVEPSPDSSPEAVGVADEGLAYVIYTSGSTGTPKGVELHHRGLSRVVHYHRELYRLGPDDHGSHLTGLGFDASVWEAWIHLTAGSQLHLGPPHASHDLRALGRWLLERRITVVVLATPVAEALIDAGSLDSSHLRLLLIGGEKVHRRPAAGSPWDLYDHYGPTECTVIAASTRLRPAATAEAAGPPPFGRPVAGSRLLLLGPGLAPVPLGVPGELYIAGDGVGRGYLGRPGQTAERFLPHPFPRHAGERLYMSGDLARHLPDGEIEYLGRLDDQVKVRGQRVELGEIEVVLARRPGIRQAVALVEGGELVSFYVAEEGAGPETDAGLATALLSELPAYMVPDRFLPLERLPLTANGKVDRRRLREAVPRPIAAGGDGSAPVGMVEEWLALLWEQTLGCPSVGRSDSFYELGGNSLSALRIRARVEETFGVSVELEELLGDPTVAALARRVESGFTGATEPLRAVPRRGDLPLSVVQQRLWVLDRLDPASARFNIARACPLVGPLDAAALAAALALLGRRHEALRTCFRRRGGRAVQQVQASACLRLPVVDLTGLPRRRREIEARCLEACEVRRPFDLERLPLARFTLLRLDAGRHRLLLALHHIVADGWSLRVLFDDLERAYAALAAGRSPELSPLPVQYADFAVWQRRRLESRSLAEQEEAWRGRLAQAPRLELPTDRPRPAVLDPQGRDVSLPLGPGLAAGLRRLARRSGSTLSMVLLAGFATLLRRWTGQAEVVVGNAVTQRDRSELARVVGFFVNVLPLRLATGGRDRFEQLLDRARAASLELLAGRDVPFDRLVEELQPRRDLSYHPLFQAMFLHEPEPVSRLLLDGLEPSGIEIATPVAQMDLTLLVQEIDDGLAATASFPVQLFVPTTAARALWALRSLLAAAAEAPETRLDDLPLLGAAERHQLVHEWNDSAWPSPAADVPGRIRRQAERRPHAVALTASGTVLTYGELDRRSTLLASAVDRAAPAGRPGAEPAAVALCLPRSPAFVVSGLAAWKAGRAYVALEPAQPEERLVAMVAEAGAGVLVTDAEGGRRLAPLVPRVPVLRVRADGELPGSPPGPAAGPAAAPHPDAVAYTVFTSGSTGTPKGVAATHAGLANLVRERHRRDRINPDDQATQVASVGFDASVWETWPYLSAGASLNLPPAEVVLSPEGLLVWLVERRITSAFLPTALAEAVLARPVPEGLSLRVLQTGGDRLHNGPPSGFPATFSNNYGPSEGTVAATGTEVPPGPGAGAPPIGRPIGGVRVQVVDDELRPVPAGVVGELMIGGAGVARGYHRRPGLTAERFVPDALAAAPGARAYRSGDLTRQRGTGELDFVGRREGQVKLRGVRVELGEIEAALGVCPGVAEAAVVFRDDLPAGGELIAYLTGPEPRPRPEALRRELARRLPASMLPAGYVFLDALPRNASGKLDRRRLPAADEAVRVRAEFAPPGSHAERRIAAAWSDVLRVDRIGVEDNFFDLGGHSLALIEIHDRLQRELDPTLSLVDLLTYPTVRGLGTYLAGTGAGAARTARQVAPAAEAADERGRRQRAAVGARRRGAQRTLP